MRIRGSSLLMLAGGLSAQQPAPATPRDDLAAFRGRLAAALRGPSAPKEVRSFAAKVSITVDAPDANADTEALVEFLTPRYLKTVVDDGSGEVVRGLGKRLPWMSENGRSYWLQGKDYTRDRKAVYRDRTIAAAMPRVLYPDRILERLTDAREPVPVKQTLRRGEAPTACLRVSGVAKDGEFPLALSPDHDGPVLVDAWFRNDDLYPLILRLTPVHAGDTQKKRGPSEELRFLDHKRWNDLVLPSRIVFRGERDGRLRLLQEVRLLKFAANPKRLTPEAFAKPE